MVMKVEMAVSVLTESSSLRTSSFAALEGRQFFLKQMSSHARKFHRQNTRSRGDYYSGLGTV